MGNMQGAYKPFCQDTFDTYDKLCRLRVSDYFEELISSKGWQLKDSDDPYAPDLCVVSQDNVEFYFEVEQKNNWGKGNFPFPTLQIPERKRKFAELPAIFCVLNKYHTRMATVKASKVISSPVVEVSNRYVKSGELFFQVPVCDVKFYQMRAE